MFARILTTIRAYACRFAILGGGASPFKGASNSEDGVTLDLSRMKHIELLEGNAPPKLKVEAGAVWQEVYHYLRPRRLYAVGTRSSLPGVVGSILGGKNHLGPFHGKIVSQCRWDLFLLAATRLVL